MKQVKMRIRKWLFPRFPMNAVTATEVKRRIADCPLEIATALDEYGIASTVETLENTAQLDGKTATILGYASALLAFLLASNETLTKQGWLTFPYSIVLGVTGVAAFWALARAALALRIQSFFALSEDDWFNAELLRENDVTRLRRFYARCFHAVHQIGGRNNLEKSAQVGLAQRALFISATGIGIMTLWNISSSLLPVIIGLFKTIRVGIGV